MEKIQIREDWKDKEHCDLIAQAAQSLYEYVRKTHFGRGVGCRF